MKNVMIFLADGFEEVEALTPVDLLRRSGANVRMVSVGDNLTVRGSHNIFINADFCISDVNDSDTDLFILPGGMPGTKNLDSNETVKSIIKKSYEKGKYVSAICAAPSVFGHIGILENKKACCYPGFENELFGADVKFEPVVVDGNIITGRGMGTAIEFGLKLVEILFGKEKSVEIGKSIIYGKTNQN